ncbi:MAG: leucine-rich repeat protein [Acetobacterium sp.]|nr:leucine-rich repeat protein [Acetobacterium sp.]
MKRKFQNVFSVYFILLLLFAFVPIGVMAENQEIITDENTVLKSNVTTEQATLANDISELNITYTPNCQNDFIVNSLTAKRSGANIIFTLDYESSREGAYSFFNPPNGDTIMKYAYNGINIGTNTLELTFTLSEFKQILANDSITMKFYVHANSSVAPSWIFFKTAQLSSLATGTDDESNSDYLYTDIVGGIRITEYVGSGGNVTIPASINGKTVLEIGDEAFAGLWELTSITVPNGITSIGEFAFESNENLISANLPNSITHIGWGAFGNCSSLTNINIPTGISSLDDTFYGCLSLKNVIIPENIKTIDGAFHRCSSLTNITIPKSVTSISGFAFDECSNLKEINVNVDNAAYSSVNGVLFDKSRSTIIFHPSKSTEVNLPESLTHIGENAFGGSTNLTNITIPDSVTDIGYYAFHDCSNLININIPEHITAIESNVFDGCSSLTSITIPNSVTSIKRGAFARCSTLANIIIPNSITEIGYGAFMECSSLTDIIIPSSVRNIAFLAFDQCTALASIQFNSATTVITGIPETTTIIGYDPSTAKDYADIIGNPFQLIDEDKTLKEIAITSPAQKLVYKVGETLDLTGLSVIGTYSDGTTRQMTFTADNILGFYSSYPETNQVLTIAIEGITTTYTIQIIASDEPIQGGLTAFLLKDVNGNFYEYSKDDINYSYVVFQMNPELPLAKMYQHFSGILSGGGKVIGLKDASKGYMDYEAAVTAFMTAQFTGKPFEMNAYLALNSSKKLTETVSNVQVVDKDGNITGIPSYSIAFYSLVTPGQKMVSVVLDVDNPADYQVSYNGIALVYDDELGAFQAEISSTTLQTLIPLITPV